MLPSRGQSLTILLAGVWLLLSQWVFYIIQNNQGVELTRAVSAEFRSDLAGSNFEYLYRAISDLNAVGLIQCPRVRQLTPSQRPILDLSFKGGCDKNAWLLEGGHYQTIAMANNGDTYGIEFTTENQTVFLVGVWATRLGGLTIILFLTLFFRLRVRQAEDLNSLRVASAENLYNLAAQVAHDIRSPVTAMNMALASLQELPEGKRDLIRHAVQRINDIANGLLQKNKSPSTGAGPVRSNERLLLTSLLDSLLSEKRTQFRERIEIEIVGDFTEGYGLFAIGNASEISRVISNLINNSVESFSDSGRVTVRIQKRNGKIEITVNDNGKGIRPEILARIGERGLNDGKEGHGLGLSHARRAIEEAGGSLSMESRVGHGTTAMISLPPAPAPKWFAGEIVLSKMACVVSVDDEPTAHEVWARRLNVLGASNRHIRLANPEQFRTWFHEHRTRDFYCLIDFQFTGHATNGLDLISQLEIKDRSCLVSSQSDSQEIRSAAEGIGVRILPKNLAHLIPIRFLQ